MPTNRDIADEILDDIAKAKIKRQNIAAELKGGGTVTREELQAIKPGEAFIGLPGIVCYRLVTADPNQIILIVDMGPRSYFRLHDHDCPELGQIIEGEVEVNDMLCRFLDTFYFTPGERHRLFTKTGCRIIVEFPPITQNTAT